MPHLVIIDKRAMELSFLDSGGTSATATSFTFTGATFGTADPERYILVGIGTSVSGGGLPTGVTIGGVTASRVKSSSLGTNPTADLWQALVPTGTSGNVVATYGSNATRIVSMGVYSLLPVLSSSYSSAKGGAGVAPLTASDSIDVPATGVVIAIGVANTGAAAWSGLTENANFLTSTQRFTCASYQSSSGDIAVSVAFATATADSVVFAVFQP